jgi:hypothetical protein
MMNVAGAAAELRESNGGSHRSADVAWQQADITAARRALDWLPVLDLGTSLQDMWQEAPCLA